ncbi:MAG: sulfotransferase [Gemmatimonadales bacterium]
MGAATGLIATVDLATYRCSCGALFRECQFWNDIELRTRSLGHPVNVFQTNFWNTHLRLSPNRLVNAILIRSLRWDLLNAARDAVIWRVPKVTRAISEMAWNTWSLASAVLEKTGKKVFVDTARDHQRPKYLATHPLLDVRVIHLIRDPRGNSASIMKHQGVDVTRAGRLWKHYNVEAARVRRSLPRESWMSLHYEELCADPAGVFVRISDFLGIERPTAQPASGSQEHHLIGNSMRLKGVTEIREDVSWQTRLSDAEQALLARIVGSTSHSLGYQWP